jgi:hypothetical protein
MILAYYCIFNAEKLAHSFGAIYGEIKNGCFCSVIRLGVISIIKKGGDAFYRSYGSSFG